MELYPFKSGLSLMEPIALQNQNVCIHYQKEEPEADWYRRVVFYESIPPFQCINVGAIVAQNVTGRTPITNLDMPADEFGQFRWFTIDNAQIRLFLPNAVARSQLKNIQAVFDKTIVDKDPCLHLTEFCVWQDNRPSVEAINFMDYGLSACRIIVMGYRFHTAKLRADVIEAIKAGKEPCTHIWCSGRGV